MTDHLPKLSAIRHALLSAPPPPAGFPFKALHDAETRVSIRRAPHLQQFLHEMRAEAQRAQSTPLEPLSFNLFRLFETTGERAGYERVYFDRRRRLAGLALTSIVDETDAYLPALNNLIWEICNEYTWALPAHLPVGVDAVEAYRMPPEQVVDLFAAETAHALAELIHLLGDRLDRWLIYRIRTEIEHRIFQPMFHSPHRFEWESAPMNWASVCGGCVGMTALLLEEDRERLTGMIDRVMRTMECFLEGFGADGGCPEGISYWVYGFGYYTYFSEMLHTFTRGELDLFTGNHIQQIATFPQVVSLGAGKFINFSDAPEQAWIHPGFASYLSQKVNVTIPALSEPDFHGDHIYRWAHLTRDLLWTDSTLLNQPITKGAFYLEDMAWVVDKRTVNDQTIVFAAKGGHNDEPHNHNDLGHFILHIGGESLLTDLGAGVYTRQYFREERYEALHTGSHGHSVPLINGQRQQAGKNYHANVLHHQTHANGVDFSLDLTNAYDERISFVRAFKWRTNEQSNTATLTLTDTFKQGEIEECFVSRVEPHLTENAVVWSGQNGRVTMTYNPQQFDLRIESLESHTHHHESIRVYRLVMRTQAAQCHFQFTCTQA